MAFKGLFIGIDQYVSDDINELSCARRDATALHALFMDTFGGTGELLADGAATVPAIQGAFERLAKAAEDDVVVVAFSGHGTTTHELVAHDTDPHNLAAKKGFYVHGVPIDAAVLPIGWERRTIEVRNDNTKNSIGWCVEAHDLAVSKLIAYRDKDRDFVRTLLVERLIDSRKLNRRLHQLPNDPRVTPTLIAVIEQWIGGVLQDIGSRR